MATVKALEIMNSGPLTTLQDRGRFGFGEYGVAPSGAVDTLSLQVGNRLVDNGADEAGLELTFVGACRYRPDQNCHRRYGRRLSTSDQRHKDPHVACSGDEGRRPPFL